MESSVLFKYLICERGKYGDVEQREILALDPFDAVKEYLRQHWLEKDIHKHLEEADLIVSRKMEVWQFRIKSFLVYNVKEVKSGHSKADDKGLLLLFEGKDS